MAAGEGELPLGSYVVLRAADGRGAAAAAGGWDSPAAASGSEPADLSIVLLHGWTQDLSAWLPVAQRLRDAYFADVLLVDFYAHGQSPELRGVRMHTMGTLVAQVRQIVEHLGWQRRRVVLGGMSMGASAALHYANLFPDSICGLLLIAPSGMPDRRNPVSHLGALASRTLLGEDRAPQGEDEDGGAPGADAAVVAGAPPAGANAASARRGAGRGPSGGTSSRRRALAKLNFIKTTPSYGHSDETLSVLRRRGWPVTVVLGRYDIVHTPQEEKWRCKAPQARIVVVPGTHWWLCTRAGDLGLESDPLWAAARAEAAQAEASLGSAANVQEGLAALRKSRL